MTTYRALLIALPILSGLALVTVIGCAKNPPAPAAKSGDRHDAEHHEHAKDVVSMGDYHAKVQIEQGGTLKLLILGKDEAKVAAIEKQEVKGHVRGEGQMEWTAVSLQPDPQPGDPPQKTSQFSGQLPESLRGKALAARFQITIEGDRYRPEFSSVGETGHGGHSMLPRGVERGSEKERQLYLTPAGLYTADDIAANGNTVPSAKFQGISWPHDDDLKQGDRVCPVTANKADPRCIWVVNGRQYEFCCPPCLDKFVTWAKTKPDKIKEPDTYVYKDE